MEKKNNDTAEMSNSKQKRVERQKNLKKTHARNMVSRIVAAVIGILIIGGILFVLGRSIYRSVTAIKPDGDYSKGLAETGFIDGVKAADHITLPDYKNLEIPLADVEFTDEEIDEEIEKEREAHKELSEDSAKAVADGDTVNIDYVGTVNGEEFEGGNSNGEGYDLEIGSGSFVDDFEQQLIGSHPGDEVTVKVTFPEDYSTAELAGKDAEFAVTVHGVYELPEFDDAFVEANLSDYGTSVEEYRTKLAEEKYEENLENAISEKMLADTTVNSYPKAFLKHSKSLRKFMDLESYESMNKMYMSYYGSGFSSFSEYTGQTDEEYDKGLDETCKEELKEKLVWQGVLEAEGVTPTEQDYRDYATEEKGSDDFDSEVESYGKGYTMSNVLKPMAIKILKEYVTVK
ncbi:MAG: trigger factor [Lachnospiraceae bacterium]|nr:trigger factor [Lachnospiraceae bacterium]